MNRFIDAVEKSIETKNWISAIALALTIPDICGSLESPYVKNGERYKSWFRRWVEPAYTKNFPVTGEHVFLSAENCWALRCSFLHAGSSEIRPDVKSALENFHFIIPPHGRIIHCNLEDNVLQLQTDLFCRDMIGGVIAWKVVVEGDPCIAAREKDMLQIHDIFER